MNWKSTLLLAGISTVLSAAACIIYWIIYNEAFYTDFSQVAGPANFVIASAFGCIMMAVGYKIIWQKKGPTGLGYMNVLYSLISFVSIVGVLGFTLPLEVESPEMFPGMVIPMHFFPALSIMTILPFFTLQKQ
jgi:apolipoprotein N-acyltransferase